MANISDKVNNDLVYRRKGKNYRANTRLDGVFVRTAEKGAGGILRRTSDSVLGGVKPGDNTRIVNDYKLSRDNHPTRNGTSDAYWDTQMHEYSRVYDQAKHKYKRDPAIKKATDAMEYAEKNYKPVSAIGKPTGEKKSVPKRQAKRTGKTFRSTKAPQNLKTPIARTAERVITRVEDIQSRQQMKRKKSRNKRGNV